MATALAAPDAPTPPEERPRCGRAMTRCECAGLSFVEIRRVLDEEGAALEEVMRRTGSASTCTACLPDLRDFLARG